MTSLQKLKVQEQINLRKHIQRNPRRKRIIKEKLASRDKELIKVKSGAILLTL